MTGENNDEMMVVSTSSSSSANSSSTWEEEFAAVRTLLMQSSYSETPAVAAALQGMDQEIKRRHRDAKLKQKFAVVNNTAASSLSSSQAMTESVVDEEDGDAVKVGYPTGANAVNSAAIAVATAAASNSVAVISGNSNGIMSDDWQSVTMEDDDKVLDSSAAATSSDTGTTTEASIDWARLVIARMASSVIPVECRTPTAAIAVALHALLTQHSFDYVCTGVPENVQSGGFAAPIRDLPRDQFLPRQWDNGNGNGTSTLVRLRYRKDAVGSMILTVALANKEAASASMDQLVQVSFEPSVASNQPSTMSETKNTAWQFALGDYINLDSWNHATHSGKVAVPPALHYKSLSTMLCTFAQQFQLGNDAANTSTTAVGARDAPATFDPQTTVFGATPYVDYTMMPQATTTVPSTAKFPRLSRPDGVDQDDLFSHQRFPDTPRFPDNRNADNGRNGGGSNSVLPFRGDFAGDLIPAGLENPFLNRGGGVDGDGWTGGMAMPGNLMGPNHPMFHGGMAPGMIGGGSGVGGFGMKPRFDPFGPPGGPTEFPNGHAPPPVDPDGFLLPQDGPPRRNGSGKQPQPPPGGTGNPNNDLLQHPPSFGGSNLYM